MSRHEPRPLVFAPDFLGIALFDPAGLRILNLWRDGRLQPVVNRPLLLSYFRVFRALGLPDFCNASRFRSEFLLSSAQKPR